MNYVKILNMNNRKQTTELSAQVTAERMKRAGVAMNYAELGIPEPKRNKMSKYSLNAMARML